MLVRPGGSRVALSVTYSPLYDEDGRLANVIANVVDVTRFREAEEMKSTFVSVISHELKTPVALIKGYANTLAREDANWDQETLREGLQMIGEESDRLTALINNLLDASRIQAGGFKLERADVDLPRAGCGRCRELAHPDRPAPVRPGLPGGLSPSSAATRSACGRSSTTC